VETVPQDFQRAGTLTELVFGASTFQEARDLACMQPMKTKTILSVSLLFSACAWQLSAQANFDSSGDGLLNGTYYVRQVLYSIAESGEGLADAANVQGTITFNGSGSYTFSGSYLDVNASTFPTPQTFTGSGTYVIAASGEGYITAISPGVYATDQIVGLVSHGIFIGSSTENPEAYNDLFIATPVASPVATNSTFNGAYSIAYMDPTFPGDALLTLSANGSGGIGNVSVTGYSGTSSTAATETLNNVSYSFSNGAAQINWGGTANSTNLIGGTELMYISPDGQFIFGGSYNGFDMFVGVLGATSNPSNYDGLYYQAGLDLDETQPPYTPLDSYYGSLQAFSTNIIGHQRLNSPLVYEATSDFTYYDQYMLNGNGTSTDVTFGQNYVSSQDGTIRIGYGEGPYLSLNIGVQAPSFSGSGVYLSPVGVVNAGSSAPFTAFVSPGEFLTLYGTNLASTTNSASVPFPSNLSGVTVSINDVPAPIYYVSPTVLEVIVPYITSPGSVAQIQVNNNGTNSNLVTLFTGETSFGAFTNNPEGGIGIIAAEHADYSLISTSSPAAIGETIQVFVAGGGAVSPSVTDGAAAPSSPLAYTTATPTVYVEDSDGNDEQATVTFSGLTPTLAGLYQIDFTVPSGLTTNTAYPEIIGPDSDTFEAILPITTTASLSARPATHRRVHRHLLPERRPKGFPKIPTE
jgi:uncharacterized protein (TIGR03437 family)